MRCSVTLMCKPNYPEAALVGFQGVEGLSRLTPLTPTQLSVLSARQTWTSLLQEAKPSHFSINVDMDTDCKGQITDREGRNVSLPSRPLWTF